MIRPPVYIAGPFSAGSHDEIERNVARAVALGRLATAWGLAPIVPHAIGRMGCHGSWDETEDGVREAALGCGIALAGLVGSTGGHLWVLLRDDNTCSVGTQLELASWQRERRFEDVRRGRGKLVQRRWDEWRRHLKSERIDLGRAA